MVLLTVRNNEIYERWLDGRGDAWDNAICCTNAKRVGTVTFILAGDGWGFDGAAAIRKYFYTEDPFEIWHRRYQKTKTNIDLHFYKM
jgi:hypothetical protein